MKYSFRKIFAVFVLAAMLLTVVQLSACNKKSEPSGTDIPEINIDPYGENYFCYYFETVEGFDSNLIKLKLRLDKLGWNTTWAGSMLMGKKEQGDKLWWFHIQKYDSVEKAREEAVKSACGGSGIGAGSNRISINDLVVISGSPESNQKLLLDLGLIDEMRTVNVPDTVRLIHKELPTFDIDRYTGNLESKGYKTYEYLLSSSSGDNMHFVISAAPDRLSAYMVCYTDGNSITTDSDKTFADNYAESSYNFVTESIQNGNNCNCISQIYTVVNHKYIIFSLEEPDLSAFEESYDGSQTDE